MCDKIGNEYFLRAQLTLECDDTGQRPLYVAFAVLCVLIYPIGERPRPLPYVLAQLYFEADSLSQRA